MMTQTAPLTPSPVAQPFGPPVALPGGDASRRPTADGDAGDPDEDARLLLLTGRGNEAALAELHHRYSSMLLAMAWRLLGDRHDAEEVLQEAFLYVWNKASGYDPSRSSVATWLWLITRSRCIDLLRRRRRLGQLRSEIRMESTVQHAGPEGYDQVLRQERSDQLQQAMERLPEPQREVLELSFYRGLTQSQVARRIGIPLGTVKTRSHLGRQKLRRELAGGEALV